jgi:hypothetical protein
MGSLLTAGRERERTLRAEIVALEEAAAGKEREGRNSAEEIRRVCAARGGGV